MKIKTITITNAFSENGRDIQFSTRATKPGLTHDLFFVCDDIIINTEHNYIEIIDPNERTIYSGYKYIYHENYGE